MPRKRSKYNVSADKAERTHEGITFDSKMEMQFYKDIVLPNYQNGNIKTFELQKPYILQPRFMKDGKYISAIKYVTDFYIVDKDDNEFIIDIKGMADAISKLKRKMMWHKYPEAEYLWLTYCKKYGGWIEYEKLQKIRRDNKKKKDEHRRVRKEEKTDGKEN